MRFLWYGGWGSNEARLVFAFYLSLYLYLFLLLFVAIAYLYHDYSDCHGCSDYYCVDPVFGEKSEL